MSKWFDECGCPSVPTRFAVQYSMVIAELDEVNYLGVKLLVRVRNSLGRFVATLGIRCGYCALVYCYIGSCSCGGIINHG